MSALFDMVTAIVTAILAFVPASAAFALGAQLKSKKGNGNPVANIFKTTCALLKAHNVNFAVLMILVSVIGFLITFFFTPNFSSDLSYALLAGSATNIPTGTPRDSIGASPIPTPADPPGPFPTYTPTPMVTPTPTNAAPTDITLTNNRADENQPAPVNIGEFSTSDPDQNDFHTYALVASEGDEDNNAFRVEDNLLQAIEQFDYETRRSLLIRVSTTDRSGLRFEKSFTIYVNDLNEPPQLEVPAILPATAGTPVKFTAHASDPEDNRVRFELENAPPGASIAPDAGLFTWTPEEPGAFVFTILARETNGEPENLSARKTVTITVKSSPIPTPAPLPTPRIPPECFPNNSDRPPYFRTPVTGGELDPTEHGSIKVEVDGFIYYTIRYAKIGEDDDTNLQMWPVIWENECKHVDDKGNSIRCQRDVSRDIEVIGPDDWSKIPPIGDYAFILEVEREGNSTPLCTYITNVKVETNGK